MGEQCGVVTITDKNLRVACDLLEIQLAQQIIGAVPASGAKDRPDLITDEHFLQFSCPPLGGSSKVKILIEDGI